MPVGVDKKVDTFVKEALGRRAELGLNYSQFSQALEAFKLFQTQVLMEHLMKTLYGLEPIKPKAGKEE